MPLSHSSPCLSRRGPVRAAAAAALCAGLALPLVVSPGAAASEVPGKPVSGLFGAQDPTFDGVFRQGLALLALDVAGVRPSADAVAFLRAQQCADGGFVGYRADTSVPCDPAKEDTNGTAVATQAFAALSLSLSSDPLAYLRSVQEANGGFPYSKGFGTDANSTALSIGAIVAAGGDPTDATWVRAGSSPYDALRSLQLGCETAGADRGAFDFQAQVPLRANDFATVQAVLGMLGQPLPVPPGPIAATEPQLDCPATGPVTNKQSADAAAGYLARKLRSGGGHIDTPADFGGGVDYGSTVNAVLALAADGTGAEAVTLTTNYLSTHVDDYVKGSDGVDRPGALANLILVAHATGRDPRSFGGTNLVLRLRATEGDYVAPPAVTPTPTPTSTSTTTPTTTPTTSPTASATLTPTAVTPTPTGSPTPSPSVLGVMSSRGSLPATGNDALAVAGTGVALLSGGLVLLLGAYGWRRRPTAGRSRR